MKLFKILGFSFTALLITSFLITAFILFYSYSSVSRDKAEIGNLLDNRAPGTDSFTIRLRKENENRGVIPVLAKSNSNQFSEK